MDAPWKCPGLSKFQVINYIGDALYPRVKEVCPTNAGRITGMLLDGLSIQELECLVMDDTGLKQWIDRAKETLETYRQTHGSLPK